MINYLKQRTKSIIIITIILLFALITTHYIYYKFQNQRDQINSSNSLEVIFHEKDKDNISLTQAIPVTDSVGLSSKVYTFTIENNTTNNVKYSVKIIDNNDLYISDGCADRIIPNNFIKCAIHKDKERNQVFLLSDVPNAIIALGTIKSKEKIDYSIRVWVSKDSTLNKNLHYHGIIQVVEDGVDVASAIN